ncbi:hypothetical protein [Jiella pelagia]|uniref:Uncharacterized protein n=1 Tax=Jiella pelagia TaxID=2986949 RepID=A0ABY7BX23_9HYPH|nr:hypothetical protein [Jiella pelagia]WAP67180.1 hypothetical protein OH818_16465 [Jiella pelagia]
MRSGKGHVFAKKEVLFASPLLQEGNLYLVDQAFGFHSPVRDIVIGRPNALFDDEGRDQAQHPDDRNGSDDTNATGYFEIGETHVDGLSWTKAATAACLCRSGILTHLISS